LLITGLFALTGGCATSTPRAEVVYFPAPPSPPRVVHLKSFNSLHALVPVRAGFVDLVRGGLVSPRVASPMGIAYRAGHLYICDAEANALSDWDLQTGRARRRGTSGDVTLVSPVAVAVDPAGTAYVADTGRGEVVAFASSGGEPRRLKPPDRPAYKPVAVAVHGSTLYVADIASHRIDTFSTGDGKHLAALGKVGTGPGELYYPMGVAISAEGHLFVSDMMNARVQIFDAQHNPLSSFGQHGTRYGDLGKPKQLAVGPDGTIIIADAEFARVHLFNRQGQLLMLIGGPGYKAGGTPMPLGVAVAPELPETVASLVPDDFHADYFFFVTNTVGPNRISLFAVGSKP
jgi:DNA-binding beta-propeller fold protein YncE